MSSLGVDLLVSGDEEDRSGPRSEDGGHHEDRGRLHLGAERPRPDPGVPAFLELAGDRHPLALALAVERVFRLDDADVVTQARLAQPVSQGRGHVQVGDGGKRLRYVLPGGALVSDSGRRHDEVARVRIGLHSARLPHPDEGVRARPGELLDRDRGRGTADTRGRDRDRRAVERPNPRQVLAPLRELAGAVEPLGDRLDPSRIAREEDVAPDLAGGDVEVIRAAVVVQQQGSVLSRLRRRLVLGKAALERAPGEHAYQAPVLGHGNALEIPLLEQLKGLVEGEVGVDRAVRRLGDRAELRRPRVAPGGDHLAHEGLARDDADEPPVLAHQDRAHLVRGQALAGLHGARRRLERRRLGDHCVANAIRHG